LGETLTLAPVSSINCRAVDGKGGDGSAACNAARPVDPGNVCGVAMGNNGGKCVAMTGGGSMGGCTERRLWTLGRRFFRRGLDVGEVVEVFAARGGSIMAACSEVDMVCL